MHEPSPVPARLVCVGDAGAGQRLDNFLARLLKGVPRSHIYRIVRSGEVRVNGSRATAAHKLQASDQVRLPPVRMAERAEPAAPAREFPLLFEDAALLAIDKPAGVAVHGGSGVSWGVIEALRAARPREADHLELVHRLDRDTSGVLLIARKRSALTALHAALREHRADKRYYAVVAGLWTGAATTADAPLHKYLTASGERRVRVDAQQGQAARTQLRPVERFVLPQLPGGGLTLMEARLLTGRTHQIRVHLAHAGHPIVGDDKYGNEAVNATIARGDLPGVPPLRRMLLHAHRLQIAHPASGEPLVLEAPLPADVQRWLQALRSLPKP